MKEKDIIICENCKEVLNRNKKKDMKNQGYKYDELKCFCGRIIYC